MKSKAIPHDPFHDNQPQVPAHVLPPPPPPDVSVDAPGGGKNVKPRILEDEGFNHAFKKEPEHTKEYDFGKEKK